MPHQVSTSKKCVSSQKVLSAAPTAIAAFVGFTEKAPTDDPNDPDGLAPRLITSWTQFEQTFGGFTPGAILPLSVYGYFANGGAWPTSCGCRTPRLPASPPAGNCPPPTASLGLPIAVESLEPDADLSLQVNTADTGTSEDDGPSPFNISLLSNGNVVESYENLTLGKGDRNVATVINATSTRVKVEVLLDAKTDLSSQIEVLKPGTYALEKAAPTPVAVNGRKFAGSESARSRHQRPGRCRGRHHRGGPGSDHCRDKGRRLDRSRSVEGSSDFADHALRTQRQPDGDPGRASRHEPAADQGMAQRRRHVRLCLRRPLLPLDQGREPDRHQRRRRGDDPAERAHRRSLGQNRRDPAGSGRRRPTTPSAAAWISSTGSPRTSRPF